MTSPNAIERRPRRTQQQRRTETERRVLEATQRIIIESGVRSVTLAAVGSAAGYSRGIVNHAFGTREALIRTLAETLQERLAVEVAQTGQRGLDRVLDWITTYLSAFRSRSNDARAFLLLWAEAITSDLQLRPIFVERDTAFRDAISREIRHGLAGRTIRRGVDPDVMALAIVGQLRGIGMQLLLTPDAADLDAIGANVVDTIERAMRAEAFNTRRGSA